MKKILDLNGIKKLSREEQKEIKGLAGSRGICCPSGRGCLIAGYCEPGICYGWGRCAFL
ncbi:hypothetical protein [Aquimarina sp. 2201CG5-10]|uniref:hypothetical protein n=1 Tax=Aquimarina callyspongiae TaxID=3098150 RepID=UPI002AB51FA3|nr:hypothetical protein [Aquimarina sp. 2201CG5-10]MDY8135356.1 hypothetical protein [Aquimarina sp. 2201CG5-10]